MATKFRRAALAAIMVTSSLVSVEVSAQSNATTQAGSGQAQTAATEGGAGFGDIIVSARRRKETIQQTPIAMTAITPAQMEATASVSIVDLQGAAPNVLISPQVSGPSAAMTSIRGLGFNEIEKSFDPSVAVVIDGVFTGTNTGQILDFFDIASIEILRGPQGTLFGRNTIGGVINVTRTRPTGEFGAKFQVDYGKFNALTTRAVMNAPVSDTLAAKAFYFHAQTDGFYRHATTGKRYGGTNNENYGFSLLFTPSDTFDALLTVEKQEQDFQPVAANITKTGEAFCGFEPAIECNRNTSDDLYTLFTSPTEGHYRAPSLTLEMNYDAGDVKITSISSYRSSKEFQTQDFDASSTDLYFTYRRQKYNQFSQELRAAGKIGSAFDYVLGGYFFKSEYNIRQNTSVFGSDPALTEQRVHGTSQSMAVFGDFNWAFADKWRLSFGGRYTNDRKSTVNSVNFVQFPYADATFNKFTPKIGVDFRPNDQHMIYASWSRGYRSGGFSGRAQTAFSSVTPFAPETVDSYEIGAKTAWFDRKLLFNVAFFTTRYQNMQQTSTIPANTTIGNETVIFNVGSSRISGAEIDFVARPASSFTLRGSVGLLHTKFKGFLTNELIGGVLRTLDYSAVDQLFAPKMTASLNADYEIPMGDNSLRLTTGFRYLAPYDQFIGRDVAIPIPATGTIVVPYNDRRVRTDRQYLIDASIRYNFAVAGSKAYVAAYGRNLLDDRGMSMSFPVATLWTFGAGREPRTYGVQFGVEF